MSAIFLDIAKAFDKVWYNGLIVWLIRKNVPEVLVHNFVNPEISTSVFFSIAQKSDGSSLVQAQC